MMKVYIFLSSICYTVPVVFFFRNVIHEFQRQKMLGLTCKRAAGVLFYEIFSFADFEKLLCEECWNSLALLTTRICCCLL
jgi:hypothetical protein